MKFDTSPVRRGFGLAARVDPASTFTRLCTSKHVDDLRLMVVIALVIAISLCITLYKWPSDPKAEAIPVQYFATSLAALFALMSWAYQAASKRLGAIDLFTSEINAICRICLIVDLAERSIKRYDKVHFKPGEMADFDAKEQYTPAYDGNISDLYSLDYEVVSRVTQFYSYRKAMLDYYKKDLKVKGCGRISI